MEDQTSPEQLRDAFRGIANDKVKRVAVVVLCMTHLEFAALCIGHGLADGAVACGCDGVSAAGDACGSRWRIRLRGLVRSSLRIISIFLGDQFVRQIGQIVRAKSPVGMIAVRRDCKALHRYR